MKPFLIYIFWCAFGNHDFQRIIGARTLSRCNHCGEYHLLFALPHSELPASFMTLEMRLNFLDKSINKLGASAVIPAAYRYTWPGKNKALKTFAEYWENSLITIAEDTFVKGASTGKPVGFLK